MSNSVPKVPSPLARWLTQAMISVVQRVWQSNPELDITSSGMEELVAQAVERILGDKNKVIQLMLDDLNLCKSTGHGSRPDSMVITKLEEAQMWLERPAQTAWRVDELGLGE